MKKVLFGIILFMTVITVGAANYELKELIPVGVKTTILTKNFSYREFFYNKNNNTIEFKSIKNISTEDRPITISVGLFDENQRNIGIFNYCTKSGELESVSDEIIKSKAEKHFKIEIPKGYLYKENSHKDIKYISVLSDNSSCTHGTSFDYVGKKIEDIGVIKNSEISSDTEIMIKILVGLGIFLVILFLYKFMFTNKYNNFDGDDVRDGYDKYNKKLQEEREEELRKNPPKVEEKKPDKPIEILEQEEEARNEDKSGTDLHNLYK